MKKKIDTSKRKYSANRITLLAILIGACIIILLLKLSSIQMSYDDNLTASPTITQSSQLTETQPFAQQDTEQAEILLNQYFTGLMNQSTSPDQRIVDYKITSIDGKKTDEGLLISVVYSVKPYQVKNIWSSTNGEIASDDWINNKVGCDFVKKTSMGFENIDGLGSGCGIPQ